RILSVGFTPTSVEGERKEPAPAKQIIGGNARNSIELVRLKSKSKSSSGSEQPAFKTCN
ncbi:hypothetical protein KI387_017251, partial [Taxus chinensis]